MSELGISRRCFFGFTVAIAGLPFVLANPRRLTLYGDGVHDDTEALQAWLAGEPVWGLDGRRVPFAQLAAVGGAVKIPNGLYLIESAPSAMAAVSGLSGG